MSLNNQSSMYEDDQTKNLKKKYDNLDIILKILANWIR